MDVLAFDIGNTRLKSGWYSDGTITASFSISQFDLKTGSGWDNLTLRLSQIVPDMMSPGFIGCASVVPEVTKTFLDWKSKVFPDWRLTSVSAGTYPYKIDYLPASSVGADRLADALAGFMQFGGPIVVVDFGTATTLNVVDKAGTFLGGVIAPGARLMAKALEHGTSQLPPVEIVFPREVIGRSTKEAIEAAITFGQIEMIDGLIDRIVKSLGAPVRAIATGGRGELFSTMSRNISIYRPTLTLEGVAMHALLRGNGK